MILVLGAGGLLGSHLTYMFQTDTIGLTRKDVDVTDFKRVKQFLDDINPDAVINCVGITKKHPAYNSDYTLFRINAEFPQWLGGICRKKKIKLIQVSTDCVYGNEAGPHTEYDKPKPANRYEETKWLGEVSSPHLTIRTSFVGYPDPSGRGLIHWLHTNLSHPIPGYGNHIWNGLTTLGLSKYLYYYAYSSDTGIRHVYGQTITKYELLQIVNRVYGWGKGIISSLRYQDSGIVNRELRTVYPRNFIPGTNNFEEMVRDMYIHKKGLTKWLSP